jgi:DNA helicase-2/ATP-dependent DNA helicase PcrA
LFPHENSVNDTRNGSNGLEEERRLMYVAVTRARQRLYLSIAQSRMLHGQTRYNIPSRFLDEIPKELMKWLTPKVDKSAFGDSPAPTFYGHRKYHDPNGSYALTDVAQGSFYSPSMPSSTDQNGWRVGMGVHHAKFGDGLIVALEGSGADSRVQVNFKHAGMKWLALSIAKLEAI